MNVGKWKMENMEICLFLHPNTNERRDEEEKYCRNANELRKPNERNTRMNEKHTQCHIKMKLP